MLGGCGGSNFGILLGIRCLLSCGSRFWSIKVARHRGDRLKRETRDAEMKKCSRCDGRGFGTWVVDNGRCFCCLGTGQVASSKAEKIAARVAAIESRMTEIVEIAESLKTAKANCRSKVVAVRIDADIDRRRKEWLALNDERKSLVG